MNNKKKTWLAIKGVLMVLFVISTLVVPPKDNFHLFMRIVMILIIGITFLMDLHEYRKGN